MEKRIALWILGWLVAAHAAFGSELRVYTEESPPFQWIDPNGEVAGVTTDVVRAVLKEANQAVPIQVVPWARGVEMVETKPNVLLYAMMRTSEREPKFEWIGGLFKFRTFLWKLKSRTDIKVSTLEDAKKYTIGIASRNPEEAYLAKKGFSPNKMQIVPLGGLNVRKLLDGRVDLISYNDTILNDYLKSQDDLNKKYRITDFELVTELTDVSAEAYLVMNKQSDPAMIDTMKKAMQRVKDSGQHQKILAKYGMRAER